MIIDKLYDLDYDYESIYISTVYSLQRTADFTNAEEAVRPAPGQEILCARRNLGGLENLLGASRIAVRCQDLPRAAGFTEGGSFYRRRQFLPRGGSFYRGAAFTEGGSFYRGWQFLPRAAAFTEGGSFYRGRQLLPSPGKNCRPSVKTAAPR